MRLVTTLYVFVVMALVGTANATIDQYSFDDLAASDRYMALIEELRCPKCQNQNLADSNAEIAQDMRNEVYRLMDEGLSDAEIVAHLVARYGDFVRYKPPVNEQTAVLWLAPVLLLLAGVGIIGFIVVSQRRAAASPSSALSEEEKQKLAQLNDEDND